MSNGHIEIHDPFSNHKDLERSTDDHDVDKMEDTVELRLLMAYTTRRNIRVIQNGTRRATTPPPPPPVKTESEGDEKKLKHRLFSRKKKKKKGWKRLPSLLRCIKPQTGGEEPEQYAAPEPDNYYRCGGFTEVEVNDADNELEDVAGRLTRMADQIPFVPPELEMDSDDDVERMIGLLLRESGDQLNERELRDMSLAKELFWNYGFFKNIVSALLFRMGLTTPDPGSPGPHASPNAQIAVACEATSRLSAMDTLPTSRLLGYGARYLNEHYSSWVQEQGGYEAAFESDGDSDVQ